MNLSNKRIIASSVFSVMALTACRDVQVTRICEPHTSGTNGVSFIFKVEDSKTGKAVNSVDFSKLSVFDGGVSTGLESAQFSIARPQNLAMRTLILLDGSGSLYDPSGNLEQKIKESVIKFIEDAVAREPNNMIGVYKFYGNREIVPVYPFSSDRDEKLSLGLTKRLSPVLEPSELQRLVVEKRAEDLEALKKAVKSDALVRRGASTALHSAILEALAELQKTSTTEAIDKPLVSARSLIVFTDGRDETDHGAMFDQNRNRVIQATQKFKERSANIVLSVGLNHSDVSIDKDLLKEIASSDGFANGSVENLETVFKGFATEIGAQTQKYYQFNMCTNRRGGQVEASLSLSGKTVPFQYDASSFRDPSTLNDCDVNSEVFPTCQVEIREGGVIPRRVGFVDHPAEDAQCRWNRIESKRAGLIGQGESARSFDEACGMALVDSLKRVANDATCGTGDGSGSARVYGRVNGTLVRSYPVLPQNIEHAFVRSMKKDAYACEIRQPIECATDLCQKK